MSSSEPNHRVQSIPIIIVSAILLITTSLACGIAARSVPTVNPLLTPSASVSGEGTLIFHSSRDGNFEIYRVQADGTGLTNLTDNPGDDIFAAWSPNGQQIAFISDRSGRRGLYVMDSDGSNPKRLYDLESANRPAWSPDGKKIALSPGVIINADGSGEPMISSKDESCINPAWSPDGTQIACQTRFTAIAVRNADLTIRNVDLESTIYLQVRRLNEFPVWSPDGARIAFLTYDTGFIARNYIYTANSDGSGLTNLTEDPARNGAPAWSPDGTKIAYTTRQCTDIFCSGVEIWLMNADGTGKIRLTYNDLEETELAWSPDGTRIAFATRPVQTATPKPGQPASPRGLFIINADGSAQTQLVAPASGNGGLSWQPIAP
jgi:TolB protein